LKQERAQHNDGAAVGSSRLWPDWFKDAGRMQGIHGRRPLKAHN
jgi:hypothetical protein